MSASKKVTTKGEPSKKLQKRNGEIRLSNIIDFQGNSGGRVMVKNGTKKPFPRKEGDKLDDGDQILTRLRVEISSKPNILTDPPPQEVQVVVDDNGTIDPILSWDAGEDVVVVEMDVIDSCEEDTLSGSGDGYSIDTGTDTDFGIRA